MKTAVVTDGKYRASLAAVRALGEAGFRVVVTQTRAEATVTPASFVSRFAAETRWIPGSCREADYGTRLRELLEAYDHPVLFCTGADTLNLVSSRREELARAADFLVAPQPVLDALNDKETVHRRAVELGLPVPREYDEMPDRFPVVIKPHCGEKAGLKARDRYQIARDPGEYARQYAAMRRYDPSPIVQEKVEGPGEGVNLLLDQSSRLVCAFCHRRLREYPVTGGPSTCCVSFYEETMIRQAYQLLASFGLDPDQGHIINGHVPVRIKKGESPVKAAGRLLVIDGGLSKAYQAQTGIAGYTLIYNSHGLFLASHEPFENTAQAIADERDIHSSLTLVEPAETRLMIRDTDTGRELARQIEQLHRLIAAYRLGLVKQRQVSTVDAPRVRSHSWMDRT